MLSVTVALVSLNFRCNSPVGKLVLNQSGSLGLVSAILSFLTVKTTPYPSRRDEVQKESLWEFTRFQVTIATGNGMRVAVVTGGARNWRYNSKFSFRGRMGCHCPL